MKIHFLGANRQVTGSRYCLETDLSRVMIDCGMFQERPYEARNWHPSTLPPSSIQAMVLTHAHIDHSGLIPKFVKDGFTSPIFATHPTVKLAEIMLRDSAKIQGEDVAYKQKRHRKEGRKSRYPEESLYEARHVDETMELMRGVEYDNYLPVTDDIRVRFHDAGHILGSAILEFEISERGRTRIIVFSGDVGQSHKPLIRDPSVLDRADYLVMESTYGDREHESAGNVEDQFQSIINSTWEAGGKLVIPTFAVERAQEILYYIARLSNRNAIPKVSVYLDSPMAVDVTKVFRDHHTYLDDDTRELIDSGTPPMQFPGLRFAQTTEESKSINDVDGPCIIMSTSGMCTAGRIKHHIKRHISGERNTILFVGYQATGTLGREILDGAPRVRIHGQERIVRAKIDKIYGFSGHADRSGLLAWSSHFQAPPQRVYLTHGEESASLSLAETLRQERQWNVTVPDYLSLHDL